MDLQIKDEIWVLSDKRPGTVSQGIGLAKEMNFDYKIIEIEYSFFAKLPNYILSSSPLRLSKKTKQEFKKFSYLPKIIISSGRRCAPIALYLKKISQNLSKIIQIMNPNLNFNKLDFVILPKHDGFKQENYKNLLTTNGALTKINQEDILFEKEKFKDLFEGVDKKIISLMLGGSSNKTKFEKNSAKNLAQNLSKITNNMNAKLVILSSRRSSKEIKDSLKKNLNCDFKFFDWEDLKDQNPYLAVIGYSDFFVITGDSVSMISECCQMKKGVYIFDEKDISSAKHRKFHQNLYDENYARKLTYDLDILENFSSNKLNEAKRIASIINKRF